MQIVQKFGGTSLGTIERIQNVAKRIQKWHEAGHSMAIVVSAMSGETNRLLALVSQMSEQPSQREQDVIVSSGEQVSMALLVIALEKLGVNAISFTGWQAGIQTDTMHGKARIMDVNIKRIEESWQQSKVVVIAGFQGITPENNISTLGRGGSDTSAVAIAITLKADECQIYTDVDGVYSTDPRLVKEAKRLNKITFEEMLEMASLGAKVLQIRSVELAYKNNLNLRVLSSMTEIDETYDINQLGGTLICPDVTKGDNNMENQKISGIAFNKDEAQIKIKGIPDQPGVAFSILSDIAKANIEVDVIVQNTSNENLTDFTFTVHRQDYKKALTICKNNEESINATEVIGNDKIVKVSLVGVGMRSHAGIASEMFSALAEANINILLISTSEIKVSVVLNEQNLEDAVRVLHERFKLDK